MKCILFKMVFLLLSLLLMSCRQDKNSNEAKKSPLLPANSVSSQVKEESFENRLKRWTRGLKHHDPKIRLEMMTRISEEKEKIPGDIFKLLGAFLLREENEFVFVALKDYLWKIDPKKTNSFLFQRLRDPRALHRIQTLRILNTWDEPDWKSELRLVAKNETDSARAFAVILLGTEHALEYFEVLQDFIKRDNYLEPPLAIQVLAPLVKTHNEVKNFLLKIVKSHPSAPVRMHCVRSLGQFVSVKELLPALADTEGDVRMEVVQQLIQHENKEEATIFLNEIILDIENRPDVRQKALEGLFSLDFEKAQHSSALLLLQSMSEVRVGALQLAIEKDFTSFVWLGEGLLSSEGEQELAINASSLEQFSQLTPLLTLLKNSENYQLSSRASFLLKQWEKSAKTDEHIFSSPQHVFQTFKQSMSLYCLNLAFSCFSEQYQKNNPSLSQTQTSLQNPVFRQQHHSLIQQLELISVELSEEKAKGALSQGEILFIKENGLWKINAIRLR